MKKFARLLKYTPIVILLIGFSLNAQVEETKKSLVVKNDGTEYVGVILKQDAREILLKTDAVGEIYIPMHEVKKIEDLREADYQRGKYLGQNIFATRYFITTNGLPMKKGDSYAMLQIPGAEIQYAVADNFTIGGMTSWLGVPLIGSAKYAINITKNFNLAIGALAGTGSWASWNSYGVLPYGALTFGNHNRNLNISAGYLQLGFEDESFSAPLLSLAGLVRLNENIALVGDSFIYTEGELFALIMPGLRFSRKPDRAFQFGLAGVYFDGQVVPVPIPFLYWFIKI